MNITRNLLHEWYHGGARTSADVRHLAAERLGLQLTAEKVANILRDQIPLEQWYQTRIMQAIKAAYPDAFVRKISAGVYSEKGSRIFWSSLMAGITASRQSGLLWGSRHRIRSQRS